MKTPELIAEMPETQFQPTKNDFEAEVEIAKIKGYMDKMAELDRVVFKLKYRRMFWGGAFYLSLMLTNVIYLIPLIDVIHIPNFVFIRELFVNALIGTILGLIWAYYNSKFKEKYAESTIIFNALVDELQWGKFRHLFNSVDSRILFQKHEQLIPQKGGEFFWLKVTIAVALSFTVIFFLILKIISLF